MGQFQNNENSDKKIVRLNSFFGSLSKLARWHGGVKVIDYESFDAVLAACLWVSGLGSCSRGNECAIGNGRKVRER
jgi:hypothetical protein